MKEAVEASEENLITNEGGPFGACIVKDGKIISIESNQVIKTNDPTAHAEIVAIRSACKKLKTYDLSGCELYTTCYPCPMCLSAIIWANIKQVYYGNTQEDAEKIGFRDDDIYEYIQGKKELSLLNMESLDRKYTIKAFKAFEEKKDKTIY